MIPNLPAANVPVLAQADPRAVESPAARVISRAWANPDPYDLVVHVALCANPGAMPPSDVEELIAASILPHCLDGWGYLGRALDCLVRGDRAMTVHLGYYAELRAAMSLLASQAVAVLDRQHVVLSPAGMHVLPVSVPTHVFVWDALQNWVRTARATALLDNILAPGGVPLSVWLREVYTGLGGQHLAEQWFEQWGLDLQRLRRDRNDRNSVSYRPSSLQLTTIPVQGAAAALRALWEPFEPIVGPFDQLDRAILRRGLELGYAAATQGLTTAGPADFAVRVDQAVDTLAPADLSADEWKRFLKRQSSASDPDILLEAEKQDPPGSPGHLFQVLSRAALLLRVAVGACENFMQRSGWRPSDVDAWTEAIGEGIGLWEPGDRPRTMADLWVDVQNALTGLAASQIAPLPNRNAWHRDYAHDLMVLGTCERIALWGMRL